MPHRIIWSWYTGCWWVSCCIWYSEKGHGWAAAPPSPLLAVPNLTTHLSTASVTITVLMYDGLLLCGFNVTIKGLICAHTSVSHVCHRWDQVPHMTHGNLWDNEQCILQTFPGSQHWRRLLIIYTASTHAHICKMRTLNRHSTVGLFFAVRCLHQVWP